LRGFTGGFPPAADTRLIERLCLHEWPYNVRELELLARRMWLQHGREDFLRASYLPKAIIQNLSTPPTRRSEPPGDRHPRRTVSTVQRSRAFGSQTRAATAAARPRVHCQTETAGPYIIDLDGEEPATATRFGRG
jgi:DNA-binding NtrC family response regulator